MANDADGPLPIITDPREGAALALLKKSRYNIFGRKTVFSAQIITTPQHHAGIEGGLGPYICTVRLTDPKMPHVSYLPDPCDIAISGDPALTSQLYALHMRVTIPVQAAEGIPKVNDIIDVILEPGDNGSPFNLQLAKGGKLRNRPDPTTQVATAECLDLSSAFQATAGAPAGAGMPLNALGARSTNNQGLGKYVALDTSDALCDPSNTEFYLTHPLQSQANINSRWSKYRKLKKRPHMGIDLRAKPNTEVYAAAKGKVLRIAYQRSGAGHMVSIEHQDGFITKYFHFIRKPTMIKEGLPVEAGDLIGNSGASGDPSGKMPPHLHFELWGPGDTIGRDPIPYIKRVEKCTTPPTTPPTTA